MKDRGKAAAVETSDFSDVNYSVSSDMPCMKHPNSSSVGICSYCLKERLANLVCSDHSFSDDTDRKSCSVEVGSVGRISFLLENEKQIKTEQVILLRSSSNSVEIKKNRNGFWKIKRLFKKNREKGDEKSEISAMGGVSRSRSLCSFRGVDDGSDYRYSSAKISDVTGGLFLDTDYEPRKSGFRGSSDTENGGDFKNLRKKIPNSDRGIFFPVKESGFSTTMDDDSAFIDLKLDLSSSSSISDPKLELFSDHGYDSAASMGNLRGGSCRMNEYDRRMKRGNNGKGNKVWKWIFRKSTTSKRVDINSNSIIKS